MDRLEGSMTMSVNRWPKSTDSDSSLRSITGEAEFQFIAGASQVEWSARTAPRFDESPGDYVLSGWRTPAQAACESADDTQTIRQSSRKRAFDILFALALMAVFLPLFLLLCLAVKLTSRGPVIFAHPRIGKDGRLFNCYKLRSMVVDADAQLARLLASDADARAEWQRDQKLRADPRITPIGTFLRSSSLDELPQLWNILIGDMSVVGPRPIVEAEAVRYGQYFRHYCTLRPGLTGLWQVSGRSDVSYDERVKLDVRYVRSRTFFGDLAICLQTVPMMVSAKGSY